MQKTVEEIAEIVGGEVEGNAGVTITGLSGIKEAKKGDLTFVASSKYRSLANATKASAIIAPRDMKFPGRSIIHTNNPSFAFAKIVDTFLETSAHRIEGIHPTAVIANSAKLGKNVSLGPCVVVEDEVKIGDNTTIQSGCFIGFQTELGADCLLYPNTTLRERITLRSRVIIHSGSVIGSDGFGFEQVEGVHEKIPQIGTVIVEDDVEIGSNVTIDRARFEKTVIGKGTKIDNLVQIGHNVIIGENCIIVSQVGISGSCRIEKNSILAGQAGIAGHITIGEGAIVAAQAGVINTIPPKTKVSGYPAKPHDKAKRVNACLQRLPQFVKKFKALEKKVDDLEKKI